ncbi:MAG: hypothetical protein ACI8WB_005247, partial [Phenylobacterium sp.]
MKSAYNYLKISLIWNPMTAIIHNLIISSVKRREGTQTAVAHTRQEENSVDDLTDNTIT